MRASARELLVPFLTPLVWRDRGANPRSTAPEADALTTRLSGPVNCVYTCVTHVLHVSFEFTTKKKIVFITSKLFNRDKNDTNCQNRMGDQRI